jgi:hypothetical protein
MTLIFAVNSRTLAALARPRGGRPVAVMASKGRPQSTGWSDLGWPIRLHQIEGKSRLAGNDATADVIHFVQLYSPAAVLSPQPARFELRTLVADHTWRPRSYRRRGPG